MKMNCSIFFLYVINITMSSVEIGSKQRCNLFIVADAEPRQCIKINFGNRDIVARVQNWKFDYVQYDLIFLFRFCFSSSEREKWIFLHVFIFNSIIMVCLQTVRRFDLKFVNEEREKFIKILVWEQSNTYKINWIYVGIIFDWFRLNIPTIWFLF